MMIQSDAVQISRTVALVTGVRFPRRRIPSVIAPFPNHTY